MIIFWVIVLNPDLLCHVIVGRNRMEILLVVFFLSPFTSEIIRTLIIQVEKAVTTLNIIMIFFFVLFFSFILYSPYLHAVMMDEPRFAQPIPNVTVAVGRDANLPCVVEHLGAYKVNITAHCTLQFISLNGTAFFLFKKKRTDKMKIMQ